MRQVLAASVLNSYAEPAPPGATSNTAADGEAGWADTGSQAKSRPAVRPFALAGAIAMGGMDAGTGQGGQQRQPGPTGQQGKQGVQGSLLVSWFNAIDQDGTLSLDQARPKSHRSHTLVLN